MINSLIASLQSLPTEISSFIALVLCLGTMLLMLRAFGALGLVVYSVLAIVTSNIQVLKVVSYNILPDPVAYGTITFATTFIANDILTEYYGRTIAFKNILLGFASMVIMAVFMISALGINPALPSEAIDLYASVAENHNHMLALFSPTVALFIASTSAYLISEFMDVWVFTFLKNLTHRHLTWARTTLATILATTVDNTVFNLIAWVVLAPVALPWPVVWNSYIVGTLLMRILIAFICSPCVGWAKHFLPTNRTESYYAKP
jgi:uncharacterized integral membrane protein (TIGR00697 family)